MTQMQNKDGDFILRVNFLDSNNAPAQIPDTVEIRISADRGTGVFEAVYQADGECKNCRLAESGVDVFVSLSRNPIGKGRIIVETISHIHDDSFPSGERLQRSVASTSVFLWDGASDGGICVTGQII